MNKKAMAFLLIATVVSLMAIMMVSAEERFNCGKEVADICGGKWGSCSPTQWMSACYYCCEDTYHGPAVDNCKHLGPSSCDGYPESS